MDALSLLKALVKIDSSTAEGANRLIDDGAKWLKRHGIFGEIIENNGRKSYVSTIGGGEKTLVFNGHLDVVSGQSDQFVPVQRDGKLFGRGTADMKGGCAAMMCAFSKLSRADLKCKVMLQLVTDEETGGKDCSQHLVEKGYTGDFVICTEPTQLQVAIQAKGMMKLNVLEKGVSAHGSRPWEGENAIIQAFQDFKAIEGLPIFKESGEFYAGSTVNLALIRGGDIYNRVPDRCVLGLDIRYVPHVDPTEIIEEIRRVTQGDVEVISVEPGVLVDRAHPYVQALLTRIENIVVDREVEVIGQHGGSDARFFAAIGIPAVEMGPSGAHWHGDGEYVDIQSVYDLERILVDFAMDFQ